MVQAHTGKPRTYLWSHRLRIYVWDRGLAHLKLFKKSHQDVKFEHLIVILGVGVVEAVSNGTLWSNK